MRPPRRNNKWRRARGFSKLRLLFVVLLIVASVAGGFYKWHQGTLEKTRQLSAERVAQAQSALQSEIVGLLQLTQNHIDLEEVSEARQALRRASILDHTGEHSARIQELKQSLIQAERAITQRKKLAALGKQIESSLDAEKFDEIEGLLGQYLELSGADQVYGSLKQRYEEELARMRKLGQLSDTFSQSIVTWDAVSASACAQQFAALGGDAASVQAMHRSLQQLRKTNSDVEAWVADIVARDSGVYSQALLDEVESKMQAIGEHPKLRVIYKKLLSYPQIIRVPSDMATLDEAYAQIRDGGTIELGEGVFYVELEINKPIEIQGAGVGMTVLESRTVHGAGLTFRHKGRQSKLSLLSIRGYIEGGGLHSLLLLDGGTLHLSGVAVSNSASHGMAIRSGLAKITDSKFFNNHWDGLAIFGANSSAAVEGSEFIQNADHGIDVWNGGRLQCGSSTVKGNSKSGVVVTGLKSHAELNTIEVCGNRECGIYLNGGSSLLAQQVKASGNRFSGLVAQRIDRLEWTHSEASNNGEFGYILGRESIAKSSGHYAGTNNKLGIKSQKTLK